MATQGLSVLSITPISSAAVQSRTKYFEEQVLNFNPPNTFLGAPSYRLSCQISVSLLRNDVVTLSPPFPSVCPTQRQRGLILIRRPNGQQGRLNRLLWGNWKRSNLNIRILGRRLYSWAFWLKECGYGKESYFVYKAGTSLAAKFLRENGITLFKVRDEIVRLIGKSDMYFFSPEHPPLTEPAQKALDWAVEEKLKSGESGEITVTHILLGIWSQKESAGYKILAGFGFDDTKAAEIAKNMDKDTISSSK